MSTHVVESDGTESYYFTSADGQRRILHREDDLPAKIEKDGTKRWYKLGYLHREGDKPAIERPDGHRAWYFCGELHRDAGAEEGGKDAGAGGKDAGAEEGGKDAGAEEGGKDAGAEEGGKDAGPAIIYSDGSAEWWVRGRKHREGGEPAVVKADGSREWWVNGERHRESTNEPAVIRANGRKEWWANGKLHRDNYLPAVITDDESQLWVHGCHLSTLTKDGTKYYYNDRHALHRSNNLPAVEYSNGDAEWWANGVCIRKQLSPVVKFVKTRPDAVTPTRAHPSDVGYDLTAISVFKTLSPCTTLYETGIVVTPPEGYYVEIVPRSSISKTGYVLSNSVGIIDPSYTGSLKIAVTKVDAYFENLELPFCRAQLVLRKREGFLMSEVKEVEATERGDGGFGSTDGKK
jgi:deoxyuridine 5'-triphosphate nucleotidohydrolase